MFGPTEEGHEGKRTSSSSYSGSSSRNKKRTGISKLFHGVVDTIFGTGGQKSNRE